MEGDQHWYILPRFSRKVSLFLSEGEGDVGRFSGDEKREPEQSMEWELDHKVPTELPSGDIRQCTKPSWDDVFRFITSPLEITPEMLDKVIELPKLLEEYPKQWDQKSLLRSRYTTEEEILAIFSAIDAHCRHRSKLFGAYTHYGNEAANLGLCYQSAIILVELTPWGKAPRTLASESSETGAEVNHEAPPRKKPKLSEGIVDSSKIYSWRKKDAQWV